jgi:hypothetical protein
MIIEKGNIQPRFIMRIVVTLIDSSFVEGGKTLQLDCKLADGWRMYEKTYCFSEGVSLEWKFDKRIQVTVSVFPRPGGTSDAVKHAPPLEISPSKIGWAGINYSAKQGTLSIQLPFLISCGRDTESLADGNIPNPRLAWHETNGKLCLHVMDQRIALRGRIKYELQVLCVFHSPLGPGPTMIEWCRRFYPGGLPTLGKKR